MQILTDAYPMHWPCGSLLMPCGERMLPGDRELDEVSTRWLAPASLDLIRGTPVNCLVVPWAAGCAGDNPHQAQLQPLLSEGNRRGIRFIGQVMPSADPKVAAASAQRSQLAALAMEVLPKEQLSMPIIQYTQRSHIRWDAPSPILTITDGVWPGLRGNGGSGGRAIQAGPTGMPWVDSNLWLVQLAKRFAGARKVWISFDPPGGSVPAPAESYILAIAEAECCGARWPLSLDEPFRLALTRKDPKALESWNQIIAALSFFRGRSAWAGFSPLGALGVASNGSPGDAFMNGEILNLLQRRQVPFRILGIPPWNEGELVGIEAMLWSDSEPPASDFRHRLLAFAQSGGLLIVPSSWTASTRSSTSTLYLDGRYRLRNYGSGWLAVAQAEWRDPYLLAEEIHLLVSRRNDPFRVGNGFSMSLYCAISPDRQRTMVHLINSDRRARRSPVSLWVKQPFRRARFWQLGAAEAVALSPVAERHGKELALPSFGVYAAVELET